jgi:Transposase DDE domain
LIGANRLDSRGRCKTRYLFLTDQFAELLDRRPAGLDLDRLEVETKAIQRQREVVDGAALLRIALARGPGALSLRQTAAWASMLGIADLSNPSVKCRLNQATDFLAALVERLLAAKAPGAELRWPGGILRLADGTCVSKPGSTGTDWRIHGVFDLGRGGFSHLELTDQHGGEALERGAPPAGEIRIGDRNDAHASALRRAAARKGKALDPRGLIAAEFMILVTSLPKSGYSAKAVLAAHRLRWQIELAFKRVKSLLHIDQLPTRTERGSRSWLYARLIHALLCDDLSQDFLESSP